MTRASTATATPMPAPSEFVQRSPSNNQLISNPPKPPTSGVVSKTREVLRASSGAPSRRGTNTTKTPASTKPEISRLVLSAIILRGCHNIAVVEMRSLRCGKYTCRQMAVGRSGVSHADRVVRQVLWWSCQGQRRSGEAGHDGSHRGSDHRERRRRGTNTRGRADHREASECNGCRRVLRGPQPATATA